MRSVEVLSGFKTGIKGFVEHERRIDFRRVLFTTCSITSSGDVFAGGSDFDRDLARTKATAETIERSYIADLIKAPQEEIWKLQEYPGSDGFACGFSESATQIRSIFEAAERAIFTMAVSGRQSVQSRTISEAEGALLDGLIEHDVIAEKYTADFFVKTEWKKMFKGHFVLLVLRGPFGFSWGSSAHSRGENAFIHAAVEAHRNLSACINLSKNWPPKCQMDQILVDTWMGRKKSNLRIVSHPIEIAFFEEDLIFHRSDEIQKGVFIARTILNGFHTGLSSKGLPILW